MNGSGWLGARWICRAAAVGCASLLVCVGAAAQTIDSLPLAHGYGAGVHAYFCGDYDRSYDNLSAVIAAGSEDPRARYFRGLASLRLGRLDEAEADFSEGATLEAAALGSWPVSRSLERIQGHDRLRLERHRARARIAAVEQGRAAERARYSGISDAQTEMLRRRRPVFEAPAADPANPFGNRPTEAPPADTDAEPLPTPDPITAGDATPPIEMPADQDPFAPSAAPEEVQETPVEPAAESESPFGDDAAPAEGAPADEGATPVP